MKHFSVAMERRTHSTFSFPFLPLFISFLLPSLLTCSFLSGPGLIGFIFNTSLMFVGSTWRTVLIAFGRHPLFSPSFGLISLPLFLSLRLFSFYAFILFLWRLCTETARQTEKSMFPFLDLHSAGFVKSSEVIHCCSQVWCCSCCQFLASF